MYTVHTLVPQNYMYDPPTHTPSTHTHTHTHLSAIEPSITVEASAGEVFVSLRKDQQPKADKETIMCTYLSPAWITFNIVLTEARVHKNGQLVCALD